MGPPSRQRVRLGRGVLDWPAGERRSDRYGIVLLSHYDANDVRRCRASWTDAAIPAGEVDLWARVDSPLESEAVTGSWVLLGRGRLSPVHVRGSVGGVLCTPSDGRVVDWLDSDALSTVQQALVTLHAGLAS